MTRYKAVRPDGTDFYTGTFDYLSGDIIVAPNTSQSVAAVGDATCCLSVSTSPTDCTGMRWPCRLLVVEPLYEWTPNTYSLPNKRACRSLRVVDERPAHEALGPQGEKVATLIERSRNLDAGELLRLGAAMDAAVDAAWGAARDAVWGAARGAARDAGWYAARGAVWGAVWGAAMDAVWGAARGAALAAARDAGWDAGWGAARAAAEALVVADLITDAQFRTLAGPWIDVIGDPR